jgi:hypothetical protein
VAGLVVLNVNGLFIRRVGLNGLHRWNVFSLVNGADFVVAATQENRVVAFEVMCPDEVFAVMDCRNVLFVDYSAEAGAFVVIKSTGKLKIVQFAFPELTGCPSGAECETKPCHV